MRWCKYNRGRDILTTLYSQALAELSGVFDRLDDAVVDRAVRMIAEARTVFIFGCGRERLQIMIYPIGLRAVTI